MLEIQNVSKTFNAGTVNQKTAHDVANAGIKVIIANGNTPNILINLKEHPMETLHTEFVARPLNK